MKFAAHVDSIQRGSGAYFSLLPPENATGQLRQGRAAGAGEDRLRRPRASGEIPVGAGHVRRADGRSPRTGRPARRRDPLARRGTDSRCRRPLRNPPPNTAAWRPSVNPWLIAVSVMLATILEVLDTSVANVALPHIAGNLSASTDEATWVLTSYLMSNAIVLPMTGWLSGLFGRKRFLIGCIVVFTLASAACGAAASLGLLVLARVIQGAAGGALQPLSQAILMESFPPHKRGVAMAVFGMGVVVAPIIGPVLGGWITDNYSWRWVFYINIPFGILAVLHVAKPSWKTRPTSAPATSAAADTSITSASAPWPSGWPRCKSSSTAASRTTGSTPAGSAGPRPSRSSR